MKIVIASDHAGFHFKNLLVEFLRSQNYTITDLGTFDTHPVDYPDCAALLANSILNGAAEKGILVCGSGVGVSIAANKFKGIRAGVCHDHYSAHQCVEHDNANVLCVGERVIGIEPLKEIAIAFLEAKFSAEPRHNRRVQKINDIENQNMK